MISLYDVKLTYYMESNQMGLKKYIYVYKRNNMTKKV